MTDPVAILRVPGVGVLATLGVLGLLYVGSAVFAPLAFALLMIALTGPMMAALERQVGRAPAFLVTLAVTSFVAFVIVSLALWAGREIAGWFAANMDRLAAAYRGFGEFLATIDVRFDAFLPDSFDARWVLGPLSATLTAVQSFGGFAILVLSFYALGLLELRPMAARLARIEAANPSLRLRSLLPAVAGQVRWYLGLWALIGFADATLCYILFRFIGLDEPFAWAILVYVLNFIPFLGPLIVAILLAVFAAAQFGSIWMILVATGGTSLINFVMGSYVKPLIAGRAISISPVLLLLSVLFWGMIWGIVGALVGVHVTIAMLAICKAIPSLRWIADIFMDSADADVQRHPQTAPGTNENAGP
jgi:predicted PurR-regulated permease PerM